MHLQVVQLDHPCLVNLHYAIHKNCSIMLFKDEQASHVMKCDIAYAYHLSDY